MAAIEVVINSLWSRAFLGLRRQVTGSIQNADSLTLSGNFALPCTQVLPTCQPKWVSTRSVVTSGTRAAERSLWVDDENEAPLEQAPLRGSRAGGSGSVRNENGSTFLSSARPKRSANSWESSQDDDTKDGFAFGRKPSQGGYIDEWGQGGWEADVAEAGQKRSSGAGVSLKRDAGVGSRSRRPDEREWEGEWGEYLQQVEKRRPRRTFNKKTEDEDRPVGEYAPQRWSLSERRRSDPSEKRGGDGRGGRYTARPGDERGSTTESRPGISKYIDKGKRGREHQTRKYAGWEGDNRSASYSGDGSMDGSTGFPARGSPFERRSESEGVRSRRDMRRERSWEDDEGGPLVKGGIELSGEVLYGVMPVQAAIRARRRELYTLYVQENLRSRKKGDKAALERIKRDAQAAGAVLQEASKHTLNLLAENRPHQGFVLDAAPLRFTALDELPPPPSASPLPGSAPLWVALDEVVDPQNFGAVLRSAYFLGAAGVLTCARNSSPLTAVVSKASAGAAESMEVFSCDHMPSALAVAVQDGWRVLGASADENAPLVTELPKGVPTVIVLGNEGVGLRTNVRRACSGFVRIAGKGTSFPFPSASAHKDSLRPNEDDDAFDNESAGESDDETYDGNQDGHAGPPAAFAVDSLNVSVAAGILMHELLAPRPASSVQANVDVAGIEEQPDDALSKLLTSQSV